MYQCLIFNFTQFHLQNNKADFQSLPILSLSAFQSLPILSLSALILFDILAMPSTSVVLVPVSCTYVLAHTCTHIGTWTGLDSGHDITNQLLTSHWLMKLQLQQNSCVSYLDQWRHQSGWQVVVWHGWHQLNVLRWLQW